MDDQRIVEIERNPRIAGTRISVYTIFELIESGWREADIAFWLRLTRDQVDAAVGYIDANREAVTTEYQKIMQRITRGNPPELQAKLDALQGSAQARLEQLRGLKSREAAIEGHPG